MAAPRLLFFLPTLLTGGAERHAIDLAERLRGQGFVCDLLVYGPQASEATLAMPGVDKAIRLHRRGMSDPAGWLALARSLRALSPDLVIGINQTPLIMSIIEKALFQTRSRLACIFHTTEMQPFESYLARPFCWLSPLADLIVYVSRTQRALWRQKGVRPRQDTLIHNGIELARFEHADEVRAAQRAALGIAPEVFLMGMVASLRPEKNHLETLAALARARAAGTRAELLVVGEGPTLPEVKARVLELGLEGNVHFAGAQAQVAPFIGACDVGILSSTSETFPLSALEFLAAGRPMISACIGGAPEIVQQDVNGLLYAPGDIPAFAQAITRIADPAARAGMAGAARGSVDRFSATTMVARYAEAFRCVIEGRKLPPEPEA